MRDFAELMENDQVAVWARLVERLGANPGCRSLDELSRCECRSVDEIWLELCNEANVPTCHAPYRVRSLRRLQLARKIVDELLWTRLKLLPEHFSSQILSFGAHEPHVEGDQQRQSQQQGCYGR